MSRDHLVGLSRDLSRAMRCFRKAHRLYGRHATGANLIRLELATIDVDSARERLAAYRSIATSTPRRGAHQR
jgi:hypothetical protein